MTQRLIVRIPLPQGAAKANDPWATCSWVGYFIEEAVERGYDEDELPPNVMRFADAWEYHGECNNGGHAQYYDNEEEARPRLKLLARFLREIGLPGHSRLIEDFGQFVIKNEDLILDSYEREENERVNEMFYGFDDRLVQLESSEGKLLEHLAHWLMHQSWIAVEASEMPADIVRLRKLIADPPSREERLAARMRRREAENRGSLIAFARRLIDYRLARRPKKDG